MDCNVEDHELRYNMKLYELAQMSPLRVKHRDGSMVNATFHHIDGSYSYCTIDREPKPGKLPSTFHIRAWTEMVKVDGRWEIADV